ncbi:hypothetical protein PILCRDRAFT_824760 [Piloderma croceum F 1598]|uniref:Glycoside hydrolase family 105 protein n=1 Tax=Piloderma croceum (strain F 1598) TaxID=765440 RepID=A0A0C3FDV4_PILCF|nr:hypothetical protein PILCRDRAFT_824760 [Piloderma croceum F 1598]
MILHPFRIQFTLLCVAALAWPTVLAQNLSDTLITVVESRLAQSAKRSWELGTQAQALLELNSPSYSVLSPQSLPPAPQIPLNMTDSMNTVLSIAHNVVANRTISNGNITGPQPLMNDTSAGDPASIGVAVLLASYTGQWSKDGLNYAGAAQDQLDYLLEVVPHTSDGAISHLVHEVQLWSDSVYMVPPYLAYYGVIFQNATILFQAYNQIRLYRSYLLDSSANNLWRHILLGAGAEDQGHWSTGNGWAAAGMLRVLATIRNSPFNSSMTSEQTDLINWINEIHTAMYTNLDSNFVFRNYADQELSSTNFYDAASTALMASTVYRLSLIAGVDTYIPQAENSRKVLSQAMPGSVTTGANLLWVPPASSSTSSRPGSIPGATTTTKAASASHSSSVAKPPLPSTTPSSSLSTVSLPSTALGGMSGSTITLTIANGTLVPPAATPQPSFCPISMNSTATTTTATISTAPASQAKRTLASIPPTNSTTTVPFGLTTCIMPPVVTTTTTITAPTPTATLPPDSPGTLVHFTSEGWLTPVVNPYNNGIEGTDSPESEAFVIMMEAAYRDWAAMNASRTTSKSKNAAIQHSSVAWVWGSICIGVVLHCILL